MALVKDNDDDDDDDDPTGYCKNLGVCCGPRQGGVGRPPGDSGSALGGPSGATEGPRRVLISDPLIKYIKKHSQLPGVTWGLF